MTQKLLSVSQESMIEQIRRVKMEEGITDGNGRFINSNFKDLSQGWQVLSRSFYNEMSRLQWSEKISRDLIMLATIT